MWGGTDAARRAVGHGDHMSASHLPHPDAERLMTGAMKAFWALVISVLVLLLGGLLLAPGKLLSSGVFVAGLVVCIVLWGLHSLDVRAHRDADRHDPATHRARERRGF